MGPARVIIVLLSCIWNASAFSLVLPAFYDTGFMGFPPRRVVHPPGSSRGTASFFFAGNREAEVKPITFCLLLLFRVFLLFLFS